MSLTQRMGHRLAKLGYIQASLAADPDFSSLRSKRMMAAMGLIVLQAILSWPAVAAFGSVGAALGEPATGAAAASASYVMSWVVLGLALLVGGRESLSLSKSLNQHITASTVRWMTGEARPSRQ